MDIAKKHAEKVAVSILSTPPSSAREDFKKYPRPIESDLAKCRDAGVDLVFNPSEAEMYPPNLSAVVNLDMPGLGAVLKAASARTILKASARWWQNCSIF